MDPIGGNRSYRVQVPKPHLNGGPQCRHARPIFLLIIGTRVTLLCLRVPCHNKRAVEHHPTVLGRIRTLSIKWQGAHVSRPHLGRNSQLGEAKPGPGSCVRGMSHKVGSCLIDVSGLSFCPVMFLLTRSHFHPTTFAVAASSAKDKETNIEE